ncbi:MAG: nucleotidyltransferase family protein [Actinobacteria bacterium]|nr:MAG: nucleotidyltransferase family protein [Actinomycetota bacterium]
MRSCPAAPSGGIRSWRDGRGWTWRASLPEFHVRSYPVRSRDTPVGPRLVGLVRRGRAGVYMRAVPDISFEGWNVDEPTFLRMAKEAIDAIDDAGIPYAFIGGIASALHGRPRWTHDVDIFVRPEDAPRTLDALAGAGFATQRTDSFWLFKGIKAGVLVDVIFRSTGDIYLDDEMLARTSLEEFKGLRLRVVAPEDLVVIKAVVHDEKTPRHWFDALGIVARAELDWDYLIRRARRAARRVASLLLYAQSNDIAVPASAIRSLIDVILEPEAASPAAPGRMSA